ncbi:MAG: SAM-dependent methyltransferase [Xanthomonadales bacterium]|nr:SAM-dependent methyltransferase [Xanthomonadales bacterium]
MDSPPAGQLVCVGTGMTLASHLTPLSRSHIETADVVFSLMSHGLVEKWLAEMHPDVRSLQPYYESGPDRLESYRRMIETMLVEVRRGLRVVGAFYGHPGVFAYVPHKAIELARREGFHAHMEPGVSAEDCLIADLGIDPGRVGYQQYEATQFMIFERRVDPAAYLVLWQIGVAGDLTSSRFETDRERLEVLVDVLKSHYPGDHEVVLYEALTLPVGKPRIDRLPLEDLPQARIHLYTTLIVPPGQALVRNQAVVERLSGIAKQRGQAREDTHGTPIAAIEGDSR